MMQQPLNVPQAWAAYQAFRQLPEVTLIDEDELCERLLGTWASADEFTARHWTNAYLAAFAQTGGLRTVSFDSDFLRFKALELLHLKPGSL